ncbi:MAG: 4Fe-4S dicluster domain-containing protein [Vicinamibacterales bacterium]
MPTARERAATDHAAMPDAFAPLQAPVPAFARPKEKSLIRRRIRYQREVDLAWTRNVVSRPGCEHMYRCIQCGTCSGTCPLSIYMDFTPRRIIQLVREGFKDDALRSQTIWLCASCYACAVHCPQDIHITDVMYTLKREAIKEKLAPKRFPIPILANEFYHMIRQRGRSSELWLVLRMMLRAHPLALLGMARTGVALLKTGRLSLARERIKGTRELQAVLPPTEEVL